MRYTLVILAALAIAMSGCDKSTNPNDGTYEFRGRLGFLGCETLETGLDYTHCTAVVYVGKDRATADARTREAYVAIEHAMSGEIVVKFCEPEYPNGYYFARVIVW